MAGGTFSPKYLGSAMSRLTVRSSPTPWDCSALGSPADTSYLGLNFAGAPSTAQVLHIRWKLILADVVNKLDGTEPLYTWEETSDGMFQARVSFRLPLDDSRTIFEDVITIGMKCVTSFQAETEASAAALQELQSGHLRICVTDVSSTRCKEIESWSYEILTKACELYHGAKSLLVSWEENMHKAERCYSPDRCLLKENSYAMANSTYGDMRPEVADQLARLIRANYLELTELRSGTEQTKVYIDLTRERVESFFREASSEQVNEYRGSLPQQVNLCMKLILQEMTVSLGWAWPTFRVTCSETSMYTCELTLLPNHVHAGAAPHPLAITGIEASSEEEAVQNSCKAAILALEREKSICLVDLNYNHRSHGELYVVEARDQMRSASLMCSKILCQWESMVGEIHSCEEQCHKVTREQRAEPGSPIHMLNHRTIEAVAGLYRACLADLQAAKSKFQGIMT